VPHKQLYRGGKFSAWEGQKEKEEGLYSGRRRGLPACLQSTDYGKKRKERRVS